MCGVVGVDDTFFDLNLKVVLYKHRIISSLGVVGRNLNLRPNSDCVPANDIKIIVFGDREVAIWLTMTGKRWQVSDGDSLRIVANLVNRCFIEDIAAIS